MNASQYLLSRVVEPSSLPKLVRMRRIYGAVHVLIQEPITGE